MRHKGRGLMARGVLSCTLLFLSAAVEARPGEGFQPHYDRGLSYYQRGEMAAAIVELQQAYSIKQLPRLLFNIAQAHRELGHSREALDYYHRYQRTAPELTPQDAAGLEAAIAQTQAMLDADGPPAPVVVEPPPPPPPLVAPAPPPARADGPAAPEPPAPAPRQTAVMPPPLPPRRPLMNAGAWTGVGLGSALLAAGAATGGLALSGASALNGTSYAGTSPPASLVSQQGHVRALSITTDALLGTAVVTLAVTLVATLARRHRERARHPPQTVTAALPTLAWKGAF